MKVAVFMLYGIPAGSAENDRSYRRYFSAGMSFMESTGQVVPVYFAGGATDPSRPKLTEAGSAIEAFYALKPDSGAFPVHAYREGLDGREALEIVAAHLLDDVTEVTVFCAWTHKSHTQYLARKILGAGGRKVEVIGLLFPHDIKLGDLIWRRLKLLPKLALSVAAWHSEMIRDFEWQLRLRHMRRCALYPEWLPPEA